MNDGTQEAEPFTAARYGALLLRHPRLSVGLPLMLALLTGVVSLVLPRWYSASASFRPQTGGGSTAKLAGLAAQFGVSVPLDDQGESPDFYADLLQSRVVLLPVVEAPLIDLANGDTLAPDLVSHYRIRSDDRGVAIDRALRRLRNRLEVTTAAKTGVLRIRVRDHDARVASAIVSSLLSQVSLFNLQSRQSRSRQEREFIEKRLRDFGGELRAAEDSVADFLRSNREYRGSPQLTFQYERLQRQVSTRQQAYALMIQDFERARVGEVRDTPVITVIDHPWTPVLPDSRQIVLKCFLAMIVGLTLASLLLLVAEGASSGSGPGAGGAQSLVVRFVQWAR